ncbi:hypothetical protein MTR67_018529 [Solanum verrucosum]|uniref:Uncharacterized protein n=1 Tax=Solanum verrucosum TaxID=315347 RepID=A0AAF0QSG5_SOLVR|nr:hypothetical protein MTR67_018529 [Solanum verrucosum]
MTQMDLLTKYVMGCGYKVVNVVGDSSGMSPDAAYFESMYNEEVQFLSNQVGGFHPSYPRPDGNQGWNKDHDGSWRDIDCDCRDGGANWRERDGDRDRYVPPYDRPKPKEPNADPESFQTEDMLARILNKVE